MSKKITVSQFIVSYLAQIGVKHVFLISGGGNVDLINTIVEQKKIQYICNHHEQASAMAAEAYGRVTQNIGVCIVTVGPGATNSITGVAGAWLDSIPTLYISGQVKRDNMLVGTKLRQLGVQEANIIEMVKPITKYAVAVMNPEEIKYHLKKAVHLAKIGRPGPVFLDIPSDVLTSQIDESVLKDFIPVESKASQKLKKSTIKEVIKYIQQAKRPIIFAGHGIRLSKARKEFLQLAERLQIPIVTTMSAHDLIPSNNPLFIGRPGVFGDRAGNFAIQTADLLISIGARHHLWNIGYNYKEFAKNAKKIVVDIDEEELKKKTIIPHIPLQMDAKLFIESMLKETEKIKFNINASWNKKCILWKEKYPIVLEEYKKEKKFVNSYYFTDVLSRCLKEGEIIFTGVGTSFTGTLQAIKIKKNQQLHCNVGCASMGYDLPAAIGACFANNKKRIILLTGDGSIMLNLQELQTISYHKLPIKIFLLNNKGYLAIRNTQNSFYKGQLAAIDAETGISFPDFKKIAHAFEIPYVSLSSHVGIEKKIKKVLEIKGPVLCDINMSPTQTLFPKVYSHKNPDGTMESRTIEDMFPFLEREEFYDNMSIVQEK